MDRSVDSRGFVQWRDNGKRYDKYSNSFTFYSETPKDIEEFIVSDSEDVVKITTPTAYGFYPFGMGFATGQDFNVNIGKADNGNELIFGEIKYYTFTSFPVDRDIYTTYIASTTQIGKVEEHWTIGGVYFPFIKSKNILNDKRFTSQQNGSSSQITDTTKPYGDIAEISVNVSEEQARLILQFLTITMRGTEQVAVYPLTYNIFGRRYDTLTTSKVKIFSEDIGIKHNGLDDVEISFKLQMVGV